MLNRRDMVKLVGDAFPVLRTELADENSHGLATLEAACFARYTQSQIDARHERELERCFALARRLYLDGDPELRNALAVSYLEGLSFHDAKKSRSWALPYLPEPLRSVFEALDAV